MTGVLVLYLWRDAEWRAGRNAQIPGVTVPLSDLPFIVVSVFASQLFHEFGHAMAAALYV